MFTCHTNPAPSTSAHQGPRRRVGRLGLSLVLTLPALAAYAATPGETVAPTAEADVPLVAEQHDPLASEYDVLKGAAGFWRMGRDHNGVWWFVSPDGQREFLNTVTTVVPYQQGRRKMGPHYISRDWHGEVTGTLLEGDVAGWAARTRDRVLEAGFKGFGAWCHKAFHDASINPDTPITRDLNLWLWTTGDARRVYHPDFAEQIEAAIVVQVEPLKDSKTLVGYFTDNELPWTDEAVGPAAYFDGLDAGDPSRQKVVETLRSLWSDVDTFNADWHSEIASFDELASWTSLPHDVPGYGKLFNAFVAEVASDYFRIVDGLLEKHDPNHLNLGVRYKGYALPEVIRGQAGYTDAVSINTYVADAKLDRDLFESLHNESGGQPVMIGEYSFHALDGRSGNRNTFGFAAQVPDQIARADGYRLMTERLASVPYIVGADWFQWSDEPPSGRRMDGEDVNFGVVDVDDREYDNLVAAVRETTPKLNGIHDGELADGIDPWREQFEAHAPTASIGYLADAPRIDGSVRDWPENFRLQGLRPGTAVGAERQISMGEPAVFAGWNEGGLYVAVEVYDANIQAAEPTGTWWVQDAVELFVSTRPDAERPARGYSPYDHQFFFVPNPFPHSGVSGTWSRWSRPGDSLNGEHEIPAKGITDAARVLPGRYVTELFIPADRLHGFDPESMDTIRFDVKINDYQTAGEFFWSAPKSAGSQFRPNTWGKLVLVRPEGGGEAQPVIHANVE